MSMFANKTLMVPGHHKKMRRRGNIRIFLALHEQN